MKNKKVFGIAFVILAIVFLVLARSLFETNRVGHIQVKQAAVTGTMSVRTTPGTYSQMFGDITDYLYSDAIYLSSENLDGGDGEESQAIDVLFPDGSCDVDFVGQYEVRADHDTWLKIKERYPSQAALKSMIRQQVVEVITNTASLMNAEDAYSSKRSDFIRLCREQLLHGLYKPTYVVIYDTIQGGQVQETRIYDVDYSVAEDGTKSAIISKDPLLGDYDIVFSQFNIKKLHNFDEKTVELIDKRKEAKAAQQSAITAKAEGEAEIAKKKAQQEAIKIEEVTKAEKVAAVAVIEAEKKYQVAEFAAKEAVENKKALIAKGEGEAEAARLKVKAGLTPQEEAEWNYKTQVGIAGEYAKAAPGAFVPNILVVGGESGGSGVNPMDAVGLNMLMDVQAKMKTQAPAKK